MVAKVCRSREYGGLLDNRSSVALRWPHVLRPWADRTAAAPRRLPAVARQVGLGNVKLWPTSRCSTSSSRRALRRHRHPRPAAARSCRTPVTRWCSRPVAMATPSSCRPTRWTATPCDLASTRQGAYFANPCYTQTTDLHPQADEYPVEADVDVGVAAQRRQGVGGDQLRRARPATISEHGPRLPPRAHLPELRQPRPARGIAAAKRAVDAGRGVGPLKNGVYLDIRAGDRATR